uniref:Uncharacterized protein n=1 Tax=Tetranychus urticae TaxID=32264 RepID=T1K0F7_TETUR
MKSNNFNRVRIDNNLADCNVQVGS